MSDTEAAVLDVAVASDAAPAEAAARDHESHTKIYLRIFAVLTVVTAIEVLYSLGYNAGNPEEGLLSFGVLVSGLIVMAFFKATLVAMYYMHLKFEPFMLRFIAVFPIFLLIAFFAWTLSAELSGYPRIP